LSRQTILATEEAWGVGAYEVIYPLIDDYRTDDLIKNTGFRIPPRLQR